MTESLEKSHRAPVFDSNRSDFTAEAVSEAGSGLKTEQPVSLPRLLSSLLLANVALYALWQGILQVLLPLQVASIDAEHKVANLAILVTINGVISLIGAPIGGALSDRTQGRFGRRTPWLLPTAIIGAFLAWAMGQTNSISWMAVVFTATWLVTNFYCGALTALFPDKVPDGRRGLASSVIGLGVPLGILAGVNLVGHFSSGTGYAVLAAIFVLATVITILGVREGPFRGVRPASKQLPALQQIAQFFSSFRNQNFRLVFTSRFLMYLAYYMVNGYLLYTLQDRVGVQNVPGQSAAVGVGILASINTATWVVVSLFVGQLADKLDRRKLFVGITGLGLASSMLIPIFFPTWHGMIVYSAFVGAFKGAYLAVDLALMSLVLPHKENEGRDMGILNNGAGASQLFSGTLAGVLITFLGGYVALFLAAAIIALFSGLTAMLIRGVR